MDQAADSYIAYNLQYFDELDYQAYFQIYDENK